MSWFCIAHHWSHRRGSYLFPIKLLRSTALHAVTLFESRGCMKAEREVCTSVSVSSPWFGSRPPWWIKAVNWRPSPRTWARSNLSLCRNMLVTVCLGKCWACKCACRFCCLWGMGVFTCKDFLRASWATQLHTKLSPSNYLSNSHKALLMVHRASSLLIMLRC